MRECILKSHRRLRSLMELYNVTQEELSELLNRSRVYISPRMNGKFPWTMDDVYEIRDFFNSFADPGEPEIIPLEEISLYFPPRK